MKDKAVRIFISHAEQDKAYLADLKRHLAPLVHEGLCEVVTDEKMAPGEKWNKSTTDAFERSHIILFLVSADFVSSWYHTGEMEHAIERYRRGQAMIIPIIVRPADWQSLPINRYNTLPKDGIPISSWEERYGGSLIRTSLSKDTVKNKDDVWSVEVIRPIKELISKILNGDIQLTEPLKKRSSKPSENSTALMSLKDKAQKLIAESNLTEASEVIQEMIVALDTPKTVNGPLLEDMVILRSQSNQLQKQYRMGLISLDEYSRAAGRINFALLDRNAQAPEYLPHPDIRPLNLLYGTPALLQPIVRERRIFLFRKQLYRNEAGLRRILAASPRPERQGDIPFPRMQRRQVQISQTPFAVSTRIFRGIPTEASTMTETCFRTRFCSFRPTMLPIKCSTT